MRTASQYSLVPISILALTGGRSRPNGSDRRSEIISILALTGGRSRGRRRRPMARGYFNSRPHGRAVDAILGGVFPGELFQFSPSREGGPRPSMRATRSSYFNSRPHGRAVLHGQRHGNAHAISILALTGGRSLYRPVLCVQLQFQFSPSREGGRDAKGTGQANGVFQFSPSREGGHLRLQANYKQNHFNSRPHGRAVAKRCCAARSTTYFNSRPRGRAVLGFSVVDGALCVFQFSPSREGGPGAIR